MVGFQKRKATILEEEAGKRTCRDVNGRLTYLASGRVGDTAADGLHIEHRRVRVREDSRVRVRENTPRVRVDSRSRVRENTPRVRENTPRVRENTPRVRENTPREREDTRVRVRENTPREREDTRVRVRENTPRVRENITVRVRKHTTRVRSDTRVRIGRRNGIPPAAKERREKIRNTKYQNMLKFVTLLVVATGCCSIRSCEEKLRTAELAEDVAPIVVAAQEDLKEVDDLQKFQEEIQRTDVELACCVCGENSETKLGCFRSPDLSNSFYSPLRDGPEMVVLAHLNTVKEVRGKKEYNARFICGTCTRALKADTIPVASVRNGYGLEARVDCLEELNVLERLMISINVVGVRIHYLGGGEQMSSSGHIVQYENNCLSEVGKLPRAPNQAGLIFVRMRKGRHAGELYAIRPDKIRVALVWLKENNHLYADIDIDEAFLRDLHSNEPNYVNNMLEELSVVVESELDVPEDIRGMGCASGKGEERSDGVPTPSESVVLGSGDPGNAKDSTEKIVMDFLKESFPADEQLNDNVVIPDPKVGKFASNAERDDPYYMAKCYVVLFPRGVAGCRVGDRHMHGFLDKKRFIQHLLRWSDRRCIEDLRFVFHMLNITERRLVNGLVSRMPTNSFAWAGSCPDDGAYAVPTVAEIESMSKTQKNERLDKRGGEILDKLQPFFGGLRGSALYWKDVRQELLCFLRSDGMENPSMFVTLSSGDAHWPELYTLMDPSLTLEQASALPSSERQRLLQKNPDIASKHFKRRFDAFFANILNGQRKPLGEIVEFFYRFEYQKRGMFSESVWFYTLHSLTFIR
jgi:hypothetical protein